MKIFENKDINEEIAASTELDNDEVLNNICGTLTVTKTATPDVNACTNKKVYVELKVVFAEKLGLVKIVDYVKDDFVAEIVEGSATGNLVGNGRIKIEENPLRVTWENLDVNQRGMTAILKFTVLVKDEAIGANNAYVNSNIQINPPSGSPCEFPLLTGKFSIPRCPEPTVASLVKNNNKDEYGCDETIHSTLTLRLDRADTHVVVTDVLSDINVGTPTNINASPGTASLDSNNNIVWQVGTVAANTDITLKYDINPDQIKTNTGFVTSEVRVDGDAITTEIVILRNTTNPDYDFLDTFVRDCPEENGECCCQACQPITVEPCDTFRDETINVESIRCTGKLVNVTVNLQNICPGRTLNVGVLLVENVTVGDETTQESRGFIVKQVTNTSTTACADIPVSGFCFPFADDTRCDAGDRTFTAKVFATYIGGTVPECDCDTEEPTPEA